MFDHIDTPRNKAYHQEKKGISITKKGRGRLRKPNMKRYEIKLDDIIRQQLVAYANKQYTTMSGIINLALREFFARQNQ